LPHTLSQKYRQVPHTFPSSPLRLQFKTGFPPVCSLLNPPLFLFVTLCQTRPFVFYGVPPHFRSVTNLSTTPPFCHRFSLCRYFSCRTTTFSFFSKHVRPHSQSGLSLGFPRSRFSLVRTQLRAGQSSSSQRFCFHFPPFFVVFCWVGFRPPSGILFLSAVLPYSVFSPTASEPKVYFCLTCRLGTAIPWHPMSPPPLVVCFSLLPPVFSDLAALTQFPAPWMAFFLWPFRTATFFGRTAPLFFMALVFPFSKQVFSLSFLRGVVFFSVQGPPLKRWGPGVPLMAGP